MIKETRPFSFETDGFILLFIKAVTANGLKISSIVYDPTSTGQLW